MNNTIIEPQTNNTNSSETTTTSPKKSISSKSKALGISSLILCILALLTSCCSPVVGIILSITSIILGVTSLFRHENKIIAIIDICLSSIAIILAISVFIFNLFSSDATEGTKNSHSNADIPITSPDYVTQYCIRCNYEHEYKDVFYFFDDGRFIVYNPDTYYWANGTYTMHRGENIYNYVDASEVPEIPYEDISLLDYTLDQLYLVDLDIEDSKGNEIRINNRYYFAVSAEDQFSNAYYLTYDIKDEAYIPSVASPIGSFSYEQILSESKNPN